MRPKNLEKEQAIRTIALQIIAEEGLENLSMQKLAKAANISPRTIYLKYENKEDLLVKLIVEEGIGAFETAVLENFHASMDFAEGVRTLWQNTFQYFKTNKPAFTLMQYGKSSPLLVSALQQNNRVEGDAFVPIHQFFARHTAAGHIIDLPFQVQRALLFAPLFDIITEYFEHTERDQQIITDKVGSDACNAVIKSLLR
ncbi:TetR/AcrR family transcriptional regulator [Chitinophaga pendula]|uniref:TetR/AcrR family transcriptional regulator n=1 Tax=Chitinophaga TaxID=79328 RepID=UPI000BB06292|nr:MULTISPECIES: TetR/AcrR family transcriptional regulator [Chitinophaga]ASZ12782.1 TetR family transcriptional regulator [Chitinophaga sp. MD30]UCJ09597.1 TetR/AcrR family transcriptional regulator [Chitinophaga pendula]